MSSHGPGFQAILPPSFHLSLPRLGKLRLGSRHSPAGPTAGLLPSSESPLWTSLPTPMKSMLVESPEDGFLRPHLSHLVQAHLPAREGEGGNPGRLCPLRPCFCWKSTMQSTIWSKSCENYEKVRSRPLGPSLAPDISSRPWVPAVQSPGPRTPGWNRSGWRSAHPPRGHTHKEDFRKLVPQVQGQGSPHAL